MSQVDAAGDFEEVMTVLKLRGVPESWRGDWGALQSDFPSGGIFFLQDEYVLQMQDVLFLPEDARKALLKTAYTIRNDLCLAKFAWFYHRLLSRAPDDIHLWTFYFPRLDEYMGNQAGLFVLAVLMSGLRDTLHMYRDRRIDSDVMLETFSDVVFVMDQYRRKAGHWGVENLWLFYHLFGRLFRLGRLQFVICRFRGDVWVFRHVNKRRVVAISAQGIEYRQDGQVNGTSHVYDTEHAWVSTLEMDEDRVVGNPVATKGDAMCRIITLKRDEWELVLEKGDPVLDIHIPEGGKLSLDLCRESIRRAEKFFHGHFPEWSYKAYTCTTWLFDNQFRDMLPADSNIVRFQNEFYLYPVLNEGMSVFHEVFGGPVSDVSLAPKDTFLRRKILEHLNRGGHMHGAGGFMLRDIRHWEGDGHECGGSVDQALGGGESRQDYPNRVRTGPVQDRE